MTAFQDTQDVRPPLPSSGVRDPLAILLAEDSPVTQDLLKHLLTHRGHSVDAVDDGAKALKALQDHPYDIVLMDFHLPTIDGLRVVAEFKSSVGARAQQPRFIAITADIEGLLAHPDDCETFDLAMAKPIDVVHLCGVVENFQHYMAWTRRDVDDPETTQPTPVILANDFASEIRKGSENSSTEHKDRRRLKRVKVQSGVTVMTLRNGGVFDCRVLDLSLSGAALQVDVRPEIGTWVRVGRTEGHVVRHTNEGIAVEFTSLALMAATRRF